MQLRESDLDFIKAEEGLSLKAYPDGQGFSIGYGHFILPGETDLLEALENGTSITQARADELFDADIRLFENCVNRAVKTTMSQSEFTALVSFSYNVGCPAFTNSTLLRRVNAGDKKAAACEFLRWVFSTNRNGQKYVVPALKKRRLKEQALYYGSNPVCEDAPKEVAGDIVETRPDMPDVPVRCPAYPQNKLTPAIIREMDLFAETKQATGKQPTKKGYRVQRQGDLNSQGGRVSASLATNVKVNGKMVSVDGSLVTGPAPKHPSVTANGSRKVYANGKPVNFETNRDANQLPRVGGSDDTFTR